MSISAAGCGSLLTDGCRTRPSRYVNLGAVCCSAVAIIDLRATAIDFKHRRKSASRQQKRACIPVLASPTFMLTDRESSCNAMQ